LFEGWLREAAIAKQQPTVRRRRQVKRRQRGDVDAVLGSLGRKLEVVDVGRQLEQQLHAGGGAAELEFGQSRADRADKPVASAAMSTPGL
jgi:hypothetical protein